MGLVPSPVPNGVKTAADHIQGPEPLMADCSEPATGKRRPTSQIIFSTTPHAFTTSATPHFPLTLSPHAITTRRHSVNPTARRPLRSSPLAGPALSSEGLVGAREEDEAKQRYKPSRILSSPELATLQLVKRPSNSSGSRGHHEEPMPPVPRVPVSAPANISLSFASGTSRRVATSTSAGRRPASQKFDTSASPISPTRASDVPFPRPRTSPNSRAPSRDPSENWLTANQYDTTPRFSRLGLASSSVVLPVSAREHKRLSRANSRSSLTSVGSGHSTITHDSHTPGRPSSFFGLSSLIGLEATSPSHSLPSLTLSRTKSEASSLGSDSVTTPASAAHSLASINEFGVVSNTLLRTEQNHSRAPTRRKSLANLTSSWNLKGLRIRLKPKPQLSRNSSSSNGEDFPPLHGNGIQRARVASDALNAGANRDHGSEGSGKQGSKASGDCGPQRMRVTWTVRRVWKTLSGGKSGSGPSCISGGPRIT